MRRPDQIGGATYKWWVFFALGIGLFTSVSYQGAVNVALPTIADHFMTDLPTAQWVMIGYVLTISALLLPMGRLSDFVGRKRVYVAGFIIFVLGGVVAGLSSNILILIMSNVSQGVGAAMTQSTSMAMIITSFPDNERGKALGLQMSVVGTGGVAGPAIGGFLVGAFGWQWVFFGVALLGSLAIAAALLILEERQGHSAADGRSRFDWLGAALSTAALVSFLLGLTTGAQRGWSSPVIALAMLSFVGLLAAFVRWELRAVNPIMDMRLFRRRLFSLGVIASFISFLGMSSVRFLMPFYLQAVLGYTPGQMGLILVPAFLVVTVIGPLSGRLSDRYGWRRFNVAGLTLSAGGLLLLSTADQDSSLGVVMAGLILQSGGMGIFNAPNNSSIISTVEKSKYGVVSGFLQLVRNSANVTSIALSTAIVTATMASMGYEANLSSVSDLGGDEILGAFTAGTRIAFLTMCGFVVVGIATSLAKRDMPEKAATTPEAESPGGKTSIPMK